MFSLKVLKKNQIFFCIFKVSLSNVRKIMIRIAITTSGSFLTYLKCFRSQIITSKVPSPSGCISRFSRCRSTKCMLKCGRKGRASSGNLVQIVYLPRHFVVTSTSKVIFTIALLARFPRDTLFTRHYLR